MDEILKFITNPVFDIGFMAQILLPSIIILCALPKREHFYFRIILFTLLCLLSSIVIPYRPFEEFNLDATLFSFITIFGYIAHFIIVVVCLYFAFDISFTECLFCCLMAYNIQHGVYCISKIFELIFPIYHELWFLYMGVQWIPNGLLALRINIHLRKTNGFEIKSFYVFIVSILALIINIALSCFGDCTSAESMYVYYFLGASIISCISMLIMQILNISQGQIQRKLEETKIMWKEDRHNYKIQKQVQEEFNMKVHDMKHFLNMFKGKVDNDVLNKMEDILHGREFTNLYETNSLPLDVVLNMKNQECISKNIQFNFSGDGKLISFMDDNDIYALFGNIIDNSIDAVKELEVEKRIINVSFFKEMGSLIISNENYYSGALSFGKNNTLLTTKKHKQGHGIGFASIKYIAHKYKGDVTFHTEGQQFFLTIVIKNI